MADKEYDGAPSRAVLERDQLQRLLDRLLAEVKRHEKWWADAHMYDGPQDLSQRHQAKDRRLYKLAEEIEQGRIEEGR